MEGWRSASLLHHFNVKELISFSFLFQKEEVFLNLVLEFIPETVYKVARHHSKQKQTIPISYIKVIDLCLYYVRFVWRKRIKFYYDLFHFIFVD